MTETNAVGYIIRLENRNEDLLKALKSAKGVIKELHNKAHGNMGKHFWNDFQDIPIMKRINKAIKDGK